VIRELNPNFVILPDATYALGAFIATTGISESHIWRAKKRYGLDLRSFSFLIGRRVFIKGENAIRYMDQLAACEAAAVVDA
jgi:hypothetical protein